MAPDNTVESIIKFNITITILLPVILAVLLRSNLIFGIPYTSLFA